MMEKNSLISCRNLNFSFSNNRVLKNINLDFYPGEFVALLGRNGAGKSTLLSCLCGLLPSKSDRLDVDGLDLTKAGRKDIARRLSYVPQKHEDMFPFSVLDVVVMGRTVFLGSFGAPGKKDVEMAQKVLGELQISDLAHRVYTSLSGGEKQLVLLARALVQTRKIVLLDEPTNHLDYKNRYLMLSELKRLSRDDGSCVVACLHDPNHALLFADRVILLHRGKIIEGSTKDVLSGGAVSRLYGIAAWQNKDSEPQNIFPAFVHKDFKGRVLLLAGQSGEGKTTMLQQIVKANKDMGFGGVVCPGAFRNGRRYSSQVHCLGTGKSAPFAKRADTQGWGGFIFSGEGRALADSALTSSVNEKKECVIVDEVGPLELRGQGHAPLLAPLLSLEKPRHIWAVRPEILDAVRHRWMLVDPVIVNVSQPDALGRIQDFLYQKGQIHD